jgi:leucyl-tRNA synthetase
MDFLSTDELGAVLKCMVPQIERTVDNTMTQNDSKAEPVIAKQNTQKEVATPVPETKTEVIKPHHIPKDSSLVSYGCLSSNLPDHGAEKYYISTAIAYTNGFPHMGHAYEALTADIIARYHRVFGHDTYFLTGSDEHGQKVAASAVKLGRQPLEHCDVYANGFQALNQRLAVSNNDYIRTTSTKHEDSARVCPASYDEGRVCG